MATGAGFAELVTANSPSSRYLAIRESSGGDGGDGAPYRAVYRLATPGGGACAVEDLGRWTADASGRPARAHGLMRLVAEDETPSVGDAAGLPERRAFARALEARLGEARPGDAGFSAAIVGVENLGELNRRYGYEAADEAIATVGRRLAANVRAIDIVAHFAGGKFAALLSAGAEEQLAIAAARLMQRVSAEPIATSAGPLRVSRARRRGPGAAPRTQRLPAVAARRRSLRNGGRRAAPLRRLHARPGDQRRASPRGGDRRRDPRRAQPAPRPGRLPTGGRRRRRARRVLRGAAAGQAGGRRNRRPGGVSPGRRESRAGRPARSARARARARPPRRRTGLARLGQFLGRDPALAGLARPAQGRCSARIPARPRG